jgi:hypothetical protein
MALEFDASATVPAKAGRYRVPVRLGQKDKVLLDRLVDRVGISRQEIIVDALRHFYWSVLVIDEGARIGLPTWTPRREERHGAKWLIGP